MTDHLDRAIEATGLGDYGDPSFREGLDRFVETLEREAALSPIAQAMADGLIQGALVNRLRVTGWWNAHPELEQERIEAPLVIVGRSRSDRTALSHLVGEDPSLRCLLAWETNESVPPPEPATYGNDPRVLAAKAREAATEAAMPGFRAFHSDPPDAPMERHVRERTQHRYGVHRYALEDYGFTREALDERYRACRERFGVPLEPR